MPASIYRVSFFEAPNGDEKTDFYFSSLAAIYDVFTPEQIGCKVNHLWNTKVAADRPFKNRLVCISVEPVYRKFHKNPKSKNDE